MKTSCAKKFEHESNMKGFWESKNWLNKFGIQFLKILNSSHHKHKKQSIKNKVLITYVVKSIKSFSTSDIISPTSNNQWCYFPIYHHFRLHVFGCEKQKKEIIKKRILNYNFMYFLRSFAGGSHSMVLFAAPQRTCTHSALQHHNNNSLLVSTAAHNLHKKPLRKALESFFFTRKNISINFRKFSTNNFVPSNDRKTFLSISQLQVGELKSTFDFITFILVRLQSTSTLFQSKAWATEWATERAKEQSWVLK